MAEPPRVPQRRHSARATTELFHSLRAEVALERFATMTQWPKGLGKEKWLIFVSPCHQFLEKLG